MKHFGVIIREGTRGYKLDRERYAIPNPHNSLDCVLEDSEKYWAKRGIALYSDTDKKYYSDEWCKLHRQDCLENFDLNMQFFASLNHDMFEIELQHLLSACPKFTEVFDLKQYEKVAGYYIMVLDEYCQVYIGTTKDIKARIQDHWSRGMPFDRLIFGGKTTSKLSINCFRPLDTTRIFAYPTKRTYITESTYIKYFSNQFVCNRLSGGLRTDGMMQPDDFVTMHRKLL